MKTLLLLYFAIGMIYCVIKMNYITTAKLDELKRILDSASSKRVRYAAMITAALYLVLFWPKFLIEDNIKK